MVGGREEGFVGGGEGVSGDGSVWVRFSLFVDGWMDGRTEWMDGWGWCTWCAVPCVRSGISIAWLGGI